MTHLPIWYLNKFDSKVCDQVVKELSALDVENASMGKEGSVVNKKYRDTLIRFAPMEYWFSNLMEQHALQANVECKWNYNINQKESLQLAEYKENQFYNWHIDTFLLSGAEADRKITVVCLLNNPSEFEGGNLEIKMYDEYTIELEKGSVVAFPSLLEHRVTPITKGLRQTATLWLSGPRFN